MTTTQERDHLEGAESGTWGSKDGRLSCGFLSFMGKRLSMEDRYDIREEQICTEVGTEAVYLFGIFDGHGGAHAAEYLKENLFTNLIKHPNFISATNSAIRETYNRTDGDFLRAEFNSQRDDGSTASTAILIGNRLYIANVGDSRAVISKAGEAVQLSDDHKPNRTDERKRIENAGGVVMWAGTWRVGGVLAMSRAFGDRLLKQFVVADPEIRVETVDEKLEFLVIASDGLWDSVSNERTMDTPGPISAEVLYDQATHRSSHTRYGQDANITVTEHARSHSKWVLDHRAAVYIQASKLYTCSKMSWVRLDWSLITALVDRWRSETSTFHMRHGEMTITLQDVAIITGLPVNGLPILWSDPPNNWEPVMQELLGVAHPNIDRGKIPYKWLRDTFSPLPELATDLQIQEYARAYILHMIGTLLFPDPSKGKVHLRWLVKLENFDEIGNLSWGSAVLAHLYDELNKVALMQTKGIYACATLLQVWSWERLPLGRPVLRQQRLTGTDPLGYKWTGKRTCPTPQRNPELPPSWG